MKVAFFNQLACHNKSLCMVTVYLLLLLPVWLGMLVVSLLVVVLITPR